MTVTDITAQLARDGIAHAAAQAAASHAPTCRITVPRLPVEARREELQRLAEAITSGEPPSPYGIQVTVAALAHRSLPYGGVRKAWRDYLDALRDWQDVDRGEITEPHVPQDDLRVWFAGDVEAALNVLINGTGGNRS